MASARQIKSCLKPLLDSNCDLILTDRSVIVLPVRHVLRAVLIDQTRSADCFRPRWYIHHLFSPRLWPHISWGEEIYRSNSVSWSLSDTTAKSDLIHQIETVALPILRRIETLDDYLRTIMERWKWHHLINDDWTRLPVELAMGNLEEARKLCEGHVFTSSDPGSKEPDVWKAEAAGSKELCRLIRAGDVAGAIAKLHDFERRTAAALKIEKHWQETPFPVELTPSQ